MKVYFSIISQTAYPRYQYEPQRVHYATDNNNNSCGIFGGFLISDFIKCVRISRCNAQMNQQYVFLTECFKANERASNQATQKIDSFLWLLQPDWNSFEINATTIIRRLEAFALIILYILFMDFSVITFLWFI